jgi:hypothetical protein
MNVNESVLLWLQHYKQPINGHTYNTDGWTGRPYKRTVTKLVYLKYNSYTLNLISDLRFFSVPMQVSDFLVPKYVLILEAAFPITETGKVS